MIDPAIAHMVAVGEKSGELEAMLKNISENLEASSDVVIERLSAAVEPLIIIFMAGVVGRDRLRDDPADSADFRGRCVKLCLE